MPSSTSAVRIVLACTLTLSLTGIFYTSFTKQAAVISPVYFWKRATAVDGTNRYGRTLQERWTTDWWLPSTTPFVSGANTPSYHTTIINSNVSSLDKHQLAPERINTQKRYTATEKKGTENNNKLNHNLLVGEPVGNLFPCPESIGSNQQCQHYEPDWQNKTKLGVVLTARIKRVRERCKDYHSYMFNASLSTYGGLEKRKHKIHETRVMINTRLKMGFCWMPKMGSMFWKRAWSVMNFAPSRVPTRPFISQMWAIKLQDFFDTQTKPKDVKEYTTYTISRSPWDRLVSVYREKCETYWEFKRSHRCKLKFGRNCEITTFASFLRCVVESFSREKTEPYGHVDRTYHHCAICDYPYDYVVLMENMAAEKEYIFKQAGVIDPRKTMDEVRAKTIRSVEKQGAHKSYTDYWKEINPVLINRVRFYYRYEIFLFDYPETPFLV